MPFDGPGPAASEHILASISDAGAGTSYSVGSLTCALARRGARVGLHTISGWRDKGAAVDVCGDVKYAAHRRDFAGLPILADACLSSDLNRRLKTLAQEVDILHANGLWLMPNIYPAWAARAGRARLVVSPRGMLSAEALAFSRGKKRIFWQLFQKAALRQGACLHVTSQAEHADVRASGLVNPVAMIPNGIDLPEPSDLAKSDRTRTVLSLGRIHPIKGLDRLIRAWALVEAHAPEWRLRIIGPAELNHDRQLVALCDFLGLKHVSIEGALFGPEKLSAYREAELFVLASRNENFAMTVAESLAAGVPVISTKGAPWSGLEKEGCGWWIDHGQEPLARTLRAAIEMPREALAAMGGKGRAWMARDFSWDRIAADMLDVYTWVTRGGPPPATVRLD